MNNLNNLEGLNDYSREFAAFLETKRPEWLEHAEVVTDDGWPVPGSLDIEIPSPGKGGPLYITTRGEEVTVSFAGWHDHTAHFALEPFQREKYWHEVLELADDIMADRKAMYHVADRGKFVASGTVEPEKVAGLEWLQWLVEKVKKGEREPLFGPVVTVHTWTGRHSGELSEEELKEALME